MRLRLDLKKFVSEALEGKLTPAEIAEFLDPPDQRLKETTKVFVGVILLNVASVVLIYLNTAFIVRPLGNAGFLVASRVTHVLPCVIHACLLLYWIKQSFTRRYVFLARELVKRNLRPNLCLTCGYNLRGTTAQACPECGTALAQGDNPDEPLPQSSADD